MKKMKGVVSMESLPFPVYEDQRTRLRHQSLLQDYEDLQKETNAMRMRLQAAKQKKLLLSAEVRFLRQRYRYLIKNPSPKPQPKQDISQPRKLNIQAAIISKGRKHNRKESTLRPPIAYHLNSNERISNGVEIALQKTAHMFDLNQNARSGVGKKDPSFLSPAPGHDLNHKDRIHSGKEATMKKITPFFDLNQISREEEELLGDIEPMRIEEPKRIITQRVVNEEQHNDIKLSVCRNVGNGSNRTVKRKISWQDQVALRV
ncbi:uncharacterized protein LOC133297961 [Gastrolobium bilobum]|uniref:uncharacterized protein LOC133297961 n=1 Tax=Gastrolobium bilobum TaxID=150636 RepID=UPI002AAF7E3B|nr:uncharacterized protein LOC133297961 [Gastrolobium bilobum]